MSSEMPAAVLFDYGGVLSEVHPVDAGFAQVAGIVQDLLVAAGVASLPADVIETDLRAGAAAYDSWKRAQSRRMRPREIQYGEYWEMVACDWAADQRAVVLGHAAQLCEQVDFTTLYRPAKPDAAQTLRALRARGIAVALVCNALSGAAARRQLHIDHLADLLETQRYSDEVRVRKPNPEFMLEAVRTLGADPAATWMVGDKFNRDILGARRAGLGKAILMASPAGPGPQPRGVVADAVLNSLTDLVTMIDALPSKR